MTDGHGEDRPDRAGIDFLAHDDADHVAIAVRDVQPGLATVAWLSSPERRPVAVTERIPFGHKVALADLAEGGTVVEYGVPVAVVIAAVPTGALVHTHNVRSAKWQHGS